MCGRDDAQGMGNDGQGGGRVGGDMVVGVDGQRAMAAVDAANVYGTRLNVADMGKIADVRRASRRG